MTKFQEEIKIAQKTAATPHVTFSKVPIFDARPRADNSAVASFNVADLEPASLRENVVREREKLHKARIGSRRNGARSARSTRLGKKARKLHQTEATPADSEVQGKVSKDGRIQQKDDASQGKKEKAL